MHQVCADDFTCKTFKKCDKNAAPVVRRKVPEDPVYVCEHSMPPTITYKSVLNGGRID